MQPPALYADDKQNTTRQAVLAPLRMHPRTKEKKRKWKKKVRKVESPPTPG
jgi:hypothetical protein